MSLETIDLMRGGGVVSIEGFSGDRRSACFKQILMAQYEDYKAGVVGRSSAQVGSTQYQQNGFGTQRLDGGRSLRSWMTESTSWTAHKAVAERAARATTSMRLIIWRSHVPLLGCQMKE